MGILTAKGSYSIIATRRLHWREAVATTIYYIRKSRYLLDWKSQYETFNVSRKHDGFSRGDDASMNAYSNASPKRMLSPEAPAVMKKSFARGPPSLMLSENTVSSCEITMMSFQTANLTINGINLFLDYPTCRKFHEIYR
jgi:hypothetical protein